MLTNQALWITHAAERRTSFGNRGGASLRLNILGRTAFEVKSDLVRELGDAEGQLSRYLPEREKATGNRFVGIATDGLDWRAYVLLRTFRVEAAKPEKLLAWLDGAAAIRAELPTDGLTLTNELGPESVAFGRAEADFIRTSADRSPSSSRASSAAQ